MSLGTVLPLVALILIIGAVIWTLSKPKRAADQDSEVVAIDEQKANLTEAFFAATRRGEATRNLVRVYSQTDIPMIEALLASEGIAIVQLNPNMNVLRTGVPIQGLNDCVFVVLEKDYSRATEIVKDYIEDSGTHTDRNSPGTKIRNVAEMAIGGTIVNTTGGKPELL